MAAAAAAFQRSKRLLEFPELSSPAPCAPSAAANKQATTGCEKSPAASDIITPGQPPQVKAAKSRKPGAPLSLASPAVCGGTGTQLKATAVMQPSTPLPGPFDGWEDFAFMRGRGSPTTPPPSLLFTPADGVLLPVVPKTYLDKAKVSEPVDHICVRSLLVWILYTGT